MLNLEELRKMAQAELEAVKALKAKNGDGNFTKEEADQIAGHLAKFDELKARIDLAMRMEEAEQFMGEPAGTKAAHLGWRESAPGEGDARVDAQAWREVEVGGMKVRFWVPEAVQKKGYATAFEAYLRKGMGELGPQDRKTLSEGVDTAGGFLVPDEYHVELIKKVAANAAIRPNARVVTTSRDMAKWPRVHYTSDDKYTSGVRLTWTGESPSSATAHRVTDPVFGLHSIPVHTAMASMPISNDLLEDSAFDVLGISSDLLAEAFALGEDDVFINGTGVARPKGILQDVDEADGPSKVVSGSASALTADGLIDLAYALPAQYERNAKWVMAKSTAKAIRKLATTGGEYLWPVVGQVGGFGGAGEELLGYPVIKDEFMPAIASNAYPIIFGDLRGYMIVDRVGLSVQRLSELYAETNITLLLAKKRVGGQVVEPWRMKVQKVSS